MDLKFYVCSHCGNIIVKIKDAGVPVMCCGQKMTEIVAGSVDAAHEKHVPVVEKNGNNVLVKVGDVAHPMIPEHFIQWIVVQTNAGYQIKYLNAGELPQANFVLADGEEVVAVYAHSSAAFGGISA